MNDASAEPATITTTDDLIRAGVAPDHPSPFGLPRGAKGRLAGWYMHFADRQHDELLDLVTLSAGERLLEVGFGPGQMLVALRSRHPTAQFAGADPSEVMLAAARRRNPDADLRLGAAAAMPFPNGSADVVLSVNNVAMWPDVDDAIDELHRVLQPGGRAIVAWHGGSEPTGHQRRLVMPEDRLLSIDRAFGRRFDVVRHAVRRSEVWEARRPAG